MRRPLGRTAPQLLLFNHRFECFRECYPYEPLKTVNCTQCLLKGLKEEEAGEAAHFDATVVSFQIHRLHALEVHLASFLQKGFFLSFPIFTRAIISFSLPRGPSCIISPERIHLKFPLFSLEQLSLFLFVCYSIIPFVFYSLFSLFSLQFDIPTLLLFLLHPECSV